MSRNRGTHELRTTCPSRSSRTQLGSGPTGYLAALPARDFTCLSPPRTDWSSPRPRAEGRTAEGAPQSGFDRAQRFIFSGRCRHGEAGELVEQGKAFDRWDLAEERRVDLLNDVDRPRSKPGASPRDLSRRARESAGSISRSTRSFRSRLRTTWEVILTSVPANSARAICEGCCPSSFSHHVHASSTNWTCVRSRGASASAMPRCHRSVACHRRNPGVSRTSSRRSLSPGRARGWRALDHRAARRTASRYRARGPAPSLPSGRRPRR